MSRKAVINNPILFRFNLFFNTRSLSSILIFYRICFKIYSEFTLRSLSKPGNERIQLSLYNVLPGTNITDTDYRRGIVVKPLHLFIV